MNIRMDIAYAVPADEAKWLSVATNTSTPSIQTETRGPRTPSADGKTGRGTGRGGKPAASKLLKLVKTNSRRAQFIRFIGGRDGKIEAVMKQFEMTRANVNSFLTAIHRDHGIGYSKDAENVALILPPKATWKNIGI